LPQKLEEQRYAFGSINESMPEIIKGSDAVNIQIK